MIASLSDIRYRYKGASDDALRGITLEVKRGEVLGLIGPDGAGKTTLLRCMAGVLAPCAGAMRLPAGTESNAIGYMSQRFSLYEDLSIRENLRLFAVLRNIPSSVSVEETPALLETAGLAPFAERLAGKLSGGMKQKLALICAMQGSPELLLLDEPGVGVDPASRRELWKIVEQARDGGRGIVWATAYLEEAARCDRVCVLHEGRILYMGKPDVLLAQLKGRVMAFDVPPTERMPLLRKLQRSPEVMDAMVEGSCVRFLLRRKQDAQAYLAKGAYPVQANFEEAFVNLIGGNVQNPPKVTPEEYSQWNNDGREVIVTENLTRCFGSFVATDSLSIRVRRGEIFGILGANGAGKTTAFRMICGLLPASAGKAEILGIDLRKNARKARAQLGYMAQKFSLYTSLSVMQNLRFFGAVYGLRKEKLRKRLDYCTEKFELGAYLNHKTGELPLGVKQRLSMACATLHEPAFLFLDEPTSGVDPFARRAFWMQINEMAAAGVTIIVTTHFMDEAQYLHRMVIMNRGKVIAQGSPEELKLAAVSPLCPHPTMEDAFIHFITRKGENA